VEKVAQKSGTITQTLFGLINGGLLNLNAYDLD